MRKDKILPVGFVPSDSYNTTDYNKFIGLKYNEVTILRFVGYVLFPCKTKKSPCVEIECSCGNKFVRTLERVKNGYVKSCGHIHTRYYVDPYQCSIRALYTRYVGRSRVEKREFTLTQDEFRELISGPCAYCGVVQSQVHKKCECQKPYPHNGIDRVDSSIGYIKENCVPCCKICNRAKSDLSLKEFKEYIIRLTKFAATKKSSKNGEGCEANTVLSSEITKGSETV